MAKKQKSELQVAQTHRERAEQMVHLSRTDITKLPAEEVQALVDELQVHQTELQLENEELRETRAILADSRDRFSDLYEFAPVGYITIDKDGIVHEGNLTAAAMLGVERRALLQSNIARFIAPQSQGDWFSYRNAAFSTGRKQACEVQMRKANGAPLVALLESIMFGTRDERRCRTAIVDFTARKHAEQERERLFALEHAARQEAERASRAKDQFLAMVSHELRTPLTPIVAWSRLLCSEKLDNANQSRALESVERNASLLSQLIEDLLDISGFIAGKIRLDFKPVDLVSILNAAINVVRHEADGKRIQIETQFAENSGLLSGDSERLQQVVWNLLSNAIKFTPAGGRVNLRLERLESAIQVTVSDTGRGISADFLPHVFDPFRQAEETGKGRRGLGLGLAIVRQIVQMHGGTVDAASSGEGKGATFTVRLPNLIGAELTPPDSRGQPGPAA